MCNLYKKTTLLLMSILSLTFASTFAYEFSFYNATNTPLGIAIQFANGDEIEPLYKAYVKPGKMKSFVPGERDIPDIKWSFCLKNLYYMKNPTMAQRAYYFARTKNWKKMPIQWDSKPLATSRKQIQPLLTKKQRQAAAQPKLVMKKKSTADGKSLCQDRHFEIVENEYGTFIAIASLTE